MRNIGSLVLMIAALMLLGPPVAQAIRLGDLDWEKGTGAGRTIFRLWMSWKTINE